MRVVFRSNSTVLYVLRSAFLIESDEFFHWNSLFSKTIWVFNYQCIAFKRSCRGLHIDINVHFNRQILRGKTVKFVHFLRVSRKIDYIWELKLQISPNYKNIYKIILHDSRGYLGPLTPSLPNWSDPWKYPKLKNSENCTFSKLHMALQINRKVVSKCAKYHYQLATIRISYPPF